jgi:hypothetical protein
MGTLTFLEDIQIGANLLYGTVPSELGLLSNLESLDLQLNYLTGEVPLEVINLPRLRIFNTSGNSNLKISEED